GAGEQGGVRRQRAPPGGEHRLGRLDDRHHAGRFRQVADSGDRRGAVGELQFEHAGAGAENRQRLGFAEQGVQAATLEVVTQGRRGDDLPAGVGEQDLATVGDGARRQRLVEGGLQGLRRRRREGRRVGEFGGDGGGDQREGVAGGDFGLFIGADEGR